MNRVSATIIYHEATGAIAGEYLGVVGQDGRIPRISGITAQEGEGIIILSPDEVDAIGKQGVAILEAQCYVDTTTDPPTVQKRIPAEIHMSKHTLCCDGKDSCTITVYSDEKPIATTLRIRGQDHGDGLVACPVEGVELTFQYKSGGSVDIAERKYVADLAQIILQEA